MRREQGFWTLSSSLALSPSLPSCAPWKCRCLLPWLAACPSVSASAHETLLSVALGGRGPICAPRHHHPYPCIPCCWFCRVIGSLPPVPLLQFLFCLSFPSPSLAPGGVSVPGPCSGRRLTGSAASMAAGSAWPEPESLHPMVTDWALTGVAVLL